MGFSSPGLKYQVFQISEEDIDSKIIVDSWALSPLDTICPYTTKGKCWIVAALLEFAKSESEENETVPFICF